METIGVSFKEDENKLTIDDDSAKKLLSDLGLRMEDSLITESDTERTDELNWSGMGAITRNRLFSVGPGHTKHSET